MWGRYHEIRSSDHFRITWSSFIQASVGCTASPILYQFLTDEIFKRLLKSTVSLSSIASSSESNGYPSCQLTYEEQNAVRYAAGYVCKKIRKQLESATCNKGQLLYSLNLLICEKPQEGESSDWMIIINRGGLLHIKNSTYISLL